MITDIDEQTMSEEKLICGCGGKVHIITDENWVYAQCISCLVKTPSYDRKQEESAIAAFRLATRADVKQGIQWISVKDRLPEKDTPVLAWLSSGNVIQVLGKTDFYYLEENSEEYSITHWAEITLPEEKTLTNQNFALLNNLPEDKCTEP